MAVRLLLLLAMTGMFATAWSFDRPEAAFQRRAAAVHVLPVRPVVDDSTDRSLTVVEVGQAVSASTELDPEQVVIPELIAPGTYRVVDAAGRVGWMSMPDDNNPERAACEAQPFYTSESEAGRWYFVRVEAAPVIASPQPATSVRR